MQKWLKYVWWINLLAFVASIFLFPLWTIFLLLFSSVVLGGLYLKLEGTSNTKFIDAHDNIRDELAKRQLEGKTPGQRF